MIARVLAGGVVAGTGLALYGRYIEPRRVQVTHLDMGGTHRIAFVTDTHIGPNFHAADLEPTIAILQRLAPDILLFGGDFISESPRYLHELQSPLARMVGTARIGSWGMWGNHDLANIRQRCAPVLAAAGVTMLNNASAHLVDDLWAVGIDDVLLGRPNLKQAFADVPDGARTIALWHAPDCAEQVVPYRPSLMLSGHTHGGQVRLPVIGALATPTLGKRYVAGKFNIDGIPLYVSRGIGIYRPPLRVNCRPEIVDIRI